MGHYANCVFVKTTNGVEISPALSVVYSHFGEVFAKYSNYIKKRMASKSAIGNTAVHADEGDRLR
jgi:hypothetical protein